MLPLSRLLVRSVLTFPRYVQKLIIYHCSTAAATAAMGLDPGCTAQEGPYLNALSATATQAFADAALLRMTNAKAALLTASQISSTANSVLATAVTTAASITAGSFFATLTPASDGTSISSDGAIYSLDCSNKQLTITYTNADGSIVMPTFIFQNGAVRFLFFFFLCDPSFC